MRRILLCAAVTVAMTVVGASVQAQRAAENAVNAAEDAFGVSVGNETVGLYSSNSARGFNPGQAGNIRLNGLYFDQQNITQGRIYAETSMRVGMSAQSYPFPAPTGIVDIKLRRPGDHFGGSVALTYGPYSGSFQGDVEVAAPIVPGKLSGLLTATGYNLKSDFGADLTRVVYGGLLNWTPSETVDVIVFKQGHEMRGEISPLIFTAGGVVPPEFDRTFYFGQPWARRHRNTDHYGAIVSARLYDDWLLRAGIFRSTHHLSAEYFTFYRNVKPDGSGDLDVLRSAPNRDLSNSGEVRLTRTFIDGPRQHTLHIAVRGRDAEHVFGGGGAYAFGPAQIGVYDPRPAPPFVIADAGLDQITQVTPGVSYVGRWRDIGEISVGAQKSIYSREVTQTGLPPARTESQPWLYNGTVAAYLSPNLALYGSYTRGLEESGIAPETATNRGEAMPASLTEQVDAGIRYRLNPRLTLIAGLFEVKKPYFDRNATNLFTHVGSLSHRGAELSLSGQLAPGLTVVAGAMFLKARIEANAAVASFIAPVPVGRPNRNIRLNMQYGPSAWQGFSVDGQINQDGSVYATRTNTVHLGANTTLDLGARYVFKIFGTSGSLRARVLNVTDAYGWSVSGSGAYTPTLPRRFTAQWVTDF